MNILVSDSTISYKNWIVVRTIKDALSVVGFVEGLVYHKSQEKSEDKIKFMTEFSKKHTSCKIVYLCAKDKADNALKMLITGGLNGKYVDDEFYLESDRELNTLLVDSAMIVKSSDLSGIDVLRDFFNRYTSGDKPISKRYLSIVKSAAIELSEAYAEKNKEILEMSESAAEIFSNSIDLIAQMREQQESLEKDIKSIRDRSAEMTSYSQPARAIGGSVLFYPRVNYLKNKAIIRIKDIGDCPYVTSFCIGFREYLERIKSVRPKLIVIEGNGHIKRDCYPDFKWVVNENKNDIRNYYDKVVFTNCPTTVIMSKLLDDSDYDTFIVLDKTENYKDHILNSKGLVIYSIASERFITQLKLPKKDCITLIKEVKGTLFSLPFFSDYPKRDDQRMNMYLRECSDRYNILFSARLGNTL